MKFENRGLIFDITAFEPFKGYLFAQSPQLLRIEDGFRIYFSARKQFSDNRMPISEILYVDFDLNFENIIAFSSKPVLSAGILGAFDEHGAFPMHVKKINSRIFGFISGWSRRMSVPVETAIGISESFDGGTTFTRLGPGPILAASHGEPFLVGDPFVLESDSDLVMFYIAGTEWRWYENEKDPQRIYKIRSAYSVDGIEWHQKGGNIIPNSLGEDECQALPTVISTRQKNIMFFCYREAQGFRSDPKKSYKIGYAESLNLIDWTRKDEILEIENHETSWDSQMKCYPHASVIGNAVYLLYNGNSFGRNGFGLAIHKLEDSEAEN